MRDKILEAVAEECHNQWSRWTEHLLGKTVKCCEEHIFVDKKFVEQWRRQIATPYAGLSEVEKESDRREARKIVLAIEETRLHLPTVDRGDRSDGQFGPSGMTACAYRALRIELA